MQKLLSDNEIKSDAFSSLFNSKLLQGYACFNWLAYVMEAPQKSI